MTMFKRRLLSTLILLPLVILAILFLPNIYMQIASGIVVSIAIWEWLHMTVLKNSKVRFVLLAITIIFAASIIYIRFNPIWIYYFSLLWWIVAFIGICYFPKYIQFWQQDILQPITSIIVFIPAWIAFNSLRACYDGPIWALLGCFLVWSSDIGAYLFGKLFGHKKLIPQVSPNKTWAGLYGGFTCSITLMLIFYFWYKPIFSWYYAVWLALVTVVFAVIGDLFESMLKRIYAVKDSGKLIPGHGGMFDRIDSLLAAFPIYYICLDLLQNICILQY